MFFSVQTLTSQDSDVSKYRLLAARNITRPQLKFKDKIDNSNKPFIPQIDYKPNALESLEGIYVMNLPSISDRHISFFSNGTIMH